MSGVELIGASGILAKTSAVTITLGDAALAVGLATSAAGAVSQGRAERQTAEFESRQLQQQAIRDQEIAAQEAEELRDDEARRRAALRARVGGSGVTLEGSPLAVMSNLASEAEFQALRIEAGGSTAASRARSQAALRRFEGRSSRQAGFTRAGASLLTGASGFT